MLPDVIQLELKARHFKGTVFNNCFDCAISKALDELPEMSMANATVKIQHLVIWQGLSPYSIRYAISNNGYDEPDFNQDKAAALNHEPETVIRTITLTKQN